MVNFKLLEVKGDYDFGSKSSEYKANVGVGNAEVLMQPLLRCCTHVMLLYATCLPQAQAPLRTCL